MPGRFIVIEGPEGAGKTTLVKAIAERLRADGVPVVSVREPGGTDVAELLRRELLNADRPWTPEAELLYMTTARTDLVTRVIRPVLAEGKVVLSDRYDLSTLAYQGGGRGLPREHLHWVNRAATGGLVPDRTLVLDIPAELGRARQAADGKGQDRLEREDPAFHDRVVAVYRAATGAGIVHLDASGGPSDVFRAAWAELVRMDPDTFRPLGE
jgi:dTMP kinase